MSSVHPGTSSGAGRHRATPRAALTTLAVVALAPSAIFVASAIGRSLQPTANEPSRTLNAIVEAALALPPAVAFVLFACLPPVAVCLAAWAAVNAIRHDDAARADVDGFVNAAIRALRHPTLLVSLLALLVGLAVVATFAVHAIAG